MTRKALRRLSVLALLIVVALAWSWQAMINMPGASYAGQLPALTEEQAGLGDRLRGHVEKLAGEFGGRGEYNPGHYAGAREYLVDQLREAGYEPVIEPVAGDAANVYADLVGTTRGGEIVVVGAHYDACMGYPGADDNASGCAGVLELARRFAGEPRGRTIRFALFANEEPPHFWTETMGSLVHAGGCAERGEDVRAMLALEMLGCYSDEVRSQHYPAPLSLLYPDTGDFIAFVGRTSDRGLVKRAVRVFREHNAFPSQGAALPGVLPGVAWSDHWSFWQHGYDAIMVTDTAMYRNGRYHTARDTADTLDYERMARVVDGLVPVIDDLASSGE